MRQLISLACQCYNVLNMFEKSKLSVSIGQEFYGEIDQGFQKRSCVDMIYNEQVFQLEETVSCLAKKIVQSPLAKAYKTTKKQMEQDEALAAKKQAFIAAKQAFEEIEQYGRHAPEFVTK